MFFRGRRYPKGTKVLRPVHPNAAIEARYKRDLVRLVREMHVSCDYWLKAAYRNNPPRIAEDAVPADVLRIAMNRLVTRWLARFDETAQRLAEYFAKSVHDRSDTQLRKILKDGGWTVKFNMTPAMRDIFEATVNQNVALIKSIPAQYLGDVEAMVQRSVQSGRDLQQLTEDLTKRFNVTRKRAELIARDQNNKATSAFNRVRMQELHIEKAIWMHSHAGKEPRPTHVKMNGKEYDVAKGMWDPAEGEYIQPGQLINCRCTSRAVLPGGI